MLREGGKQPSCSARSRGHVELRMSRKLLWNCSLGQLLLTKLLAATTASRVPRGGEGWWLALRLGLEEDWWVLRVANRAMAVRYRGQSS